MCVSVCVCVTVCICEKACVCVFVIKVFGGSGMTAVPSGHNITTKTGIMERGEERERDDSLLTF